MHTFMPDDRIRIHHNGGFDGTIVFYDKKTDQEVRVKSEDLLAFVADRYVRRRMEEWLEKADDHTLLVSLLPALLAIDRVRKGEKP